MTECWSPIALPLLPLLGFLLNAFFGPRMGKGFVRFVACALPIAAFFVTLGSCYALASHDPSLGPWQGLSSNLGPWIHFNGFEARPVAIDFLFRIDRLTLLMAFVVTGVGSLIHIYATGYMADVSDTRFARFFAYLNLFMAMMLILITGGNLVLLFVGWEGVGLCSYLLIGFEYEEDWKAAAGMKAFIANRVGDLAFILGMLLIVQLEWSQLPTGIATLSFEHIKSLGEQGVRLFYAPEGTQLALLAPLGLAGLLLFIGATGKSAQIPLFVWLPDAMAGPTPVSALIHAATMVTAGVYLIVRCGALFAAAKIFGIPVLDIVTIIGALTAFVAATAAVVQTDIKKVLAYSTVSQLGYMMMGAGALAYDGAVFHLMTHAFFKALLFLGAGAVIHALHGEQDMRKMGGLKDHLPSCFLAFAIGCAALAGIPLLAGFFSKDAILFAVLERYVAGGGSKWLLLYIIGVATAGLTAYYSVRLMRLTFFGESRVEKDTLLHLHHPSSGMALALYVLAGLSVIGGYVGLPPAVAGKGGYAIGAYLEPYKVEARQAEALYRRLELADKPDKPETGDRPTHSSAAHSGAEDPIAEAWHHKHVLAEWFSMILSIFVVAASGFFGWKRWETPRPEPEPGSGASLGQEFLREAWGFDQAYSTLIVAPLVLISRWLHRFVDVGIFDKSIVEGSGQLSLWISDLVTAFQTGRVTRSAAYLVAGAVLLLYFAARAAFNG